MDFKIDIEDYMKSIHTIRQQNGYYVSCHDHHYSFDMFHFLPSSPQLSGKLLQVSMSAGH